ncbi:hypothetical protein PYCC9005_001428 [Savitreella phatthalungensis]
MTSVSINVYDLLPSSWLSGALWSVGLGINHSGVVVDGREWQFGGHDMDGVTGVFCTEPRDVPADATYKTTLAVGVCRLSMQEIGDVLDQMRHEYTGTSYDLLTRNCNHFSADLAERLCGADVPAWLNRIAGMAANLPSCVSGALVSPPTAALTAEQDASARLLPPSETLHMYQRTD